MSFSWKYMLVWTTVFIIVRSSIGLDVELREVRIPTEEVVRSSDSEDYVDADCYVGSCIGMLTRDGSMELDSRFGCRLPPPENMTYSIDCSVGYEMNGYIVGLYDDDYYYSYYMDDDYLSQDTDLLTIASVKVAFHPESARSVNITTYPGNNIVRWTAEAGTTELQEVPDMAGLVLDSFSLTGDIYDEGEYFAILETEIYVTVSEVPVTGVSATDRLSVIATSTTDSNSASATLDGDGSAASTWTCSGALTCDITYDLGSLESMDQIRIDFVEDFTTPGGMFNVYAAIEDGDFSSVLTGAKAGQRAETTGIGLQTFGGVRALARFVKIEAIPANGGAIVISEVDVRVGETAPSRPVAHNTWLKPLGIMPRGTKPSSSSPPAYDSRSESEGGCSSAPLEGCHIFFIKDGLDTPQSRWTCGPAMDPDEEDEVCAVEFDLLYFRDIRQIQLSFYDGDSQYNEFSIEAEVHYNSSDSAWVAVVPSVITGGNTTGPQTFDLRVNTNMIKFVPKFQRMGQLINVKEMVIFETKGSKGVPITGNFLGYNEYNPVMAYADTPEVREHLAFVLNTVDDSWNVQFPDTMLTGVRMKFPEGRIFTFDLVSEYYDEGEDDWLEVVESFTTAGGKRQWETFSLSEPIITDRVGILATGGPVEPGYPVLKVGIIEVIGDIVRDPTQITVASAASYDWGGVPDIYGDGYSDQEEIMTAICTAKGASYDGMDCVGELNNATAIVNFVNGDYYIDGPIYVKDGITLQGNYDMYSFDSRFILYDGPNTGVSPDKGIIIVDSVSDAKVSGLYWRLKDEDATEISGTIGDLCLEVKNSQDLAIDNIGFKSCPMGGISIVDSQNIQAYELSGYTESSNGNMIDIVRTDNVTIGVQSVIDGLLIEDSTDITLKGEIGSDHRWSYVGPPTGGSQQASVVITGESSGIEFIDLEGILTGPAPRVLIESTAPFTLDSGGVNTFVDAIPGECLVQVPEGSPDSIFIQLNANQTLTRSGDCFTLED